MSESEMFTCKSIDSEVTFLKIFLYFLKLKMTWSFYCYLSAQLFVEPFRTTTTSLNPDETWHIDQNASKYQFIIVDKATNVLDASLLQHIKSSEYSLNFNSSGHPGTR